METKIAFPGLGIGEFDLNNVAFTLGDGFEVYWYGIILTSGILFAMAYVLFRSKYEKVVSDDIIDIALWTVILGIVGARTYYVLTSLDHYIPEPFNLLEFLKGVVNLRNGGIAIYGSIIGGALGIIIGTRIKKINTLKFMDMTAPGVMIGQILGRWGNFFNGEAFGGQVGEGHPLYFLRMGLISDNTVDDFGTFEMVYVHPTFLYESLWNLAGFFLINALYKKKKFNGQVTCMYLAWYGFGRMFIEGLRTDSLYVGQFRISQVVGLLCFVIFGTLWVLGIIHAKKLEGRSNLNKFEALLIPSLEMNPVFFKKNEKCGDGDDSDKNNTDIEEKSETRENQDGADN